MRARHVPYRRALRRMKTGNRPTGALAKQDGSVERPLAIHRDALASLSFTAGVL